VWNLLPIKGVFIFYSIISNLGEYRPGGGATFKFFYIFSILALGTEQNDDYLSSNFFKSWSTFLDNYDFDYFVPSPFLNYSLNLLFFIIFSNFPYIISIFFDNLNYY
jgi:hypothetical protein